MKKLKITVYLLSLFLVSLNVSCDKSVLSDIELQDPSLINMKVRIYQKSDNERFVDIRPKDKKQRFIRLQNGAVMVNGEAVSYKHSTINGLLRAYRYKAQIGEVNFTITVKYNSTSVYTFQYGLEEGFPCFGTETVIVTFPDLETSSYYNEGYFFLNNDNIPFRKNRIFVNYKVYKKMSDMEN